MAKLTSKSGNILGGEKGAPRWRKTQMQAWRKWAGINQTDAAQYLAELGLLEVGSHASISRWENGEISPSAAQIDALAILYGTDYYSLLNVPPPPKGSQNSKTLDKLVQNWQQAEPSDQDTIFEVAEKLARKRSVGKQ